MRSTTTTASPPKSGRSVSSRSIGSQSITRVVPFAVAGMLTIISATLHGRLSGRWNATDHFAAGAERLTSLPKEFGPWEVLEQKTLPESSVEMLQCAAYRHCSYRHRETGEVVDMVVLLGPVGPIAAHTPEVCYPSSNYQMLDQRRRTTIDYSTPNNQPTRAEVWGVSFEENSVATQRVRVYYGWSLGDRWTAPEEARFAFAGNQRLYKIQLATHLPPTGDNGDRVGDDAGQRFLKACLPILQEFLISHHTRHST